MFLERHLQLETDLRHRSVFLFGPRQTGKTTLLRRRYPDAFHVNLLDGRRFLSYSAEPWRIGEETAGLAPGSVVVIDEIQRLPHLLNEVHNLIEARGLRFVLTGSSPAKLRRGGVNLLGGRARIRRLFPLVYPEIPSWDLDRILATGSLPSVFLSDDPWEDLRAYAGIYLQQEIQAEGLVRGIDRFSRFLHTAALVAGQQVVFESIASDAQVPARTVREYFAILEQTLIGRTVAPYQPGAVASRKAVARGKFFFFDVGVVQALTGRRTVVRRTPEYGAALEQYLFSEIEAWTAYGRVGSELGYWRTVDGMEVDFVVPGRFAVEIKAGRSIGAGDVRGLKALCTDAPELRPLVVCTDEVARTIDGIEVLPVQRFLDRLWGGEF